MKKTVTIKADDLREFETKVPVSLRFEAQNDELKGVEVVFSDASRLLLTTPWSSITASKPATEKRYIATITDSREQFPDTRHVFDAADKRADWLDAFDNANGRFGVAVSEYEVTP